MALKITKQEYMKLIEQDLEILNKYLPDNPENDHIKLVLCDSIEMHYPSEGNQANTEDGKLPIADVSGSLLVKDLLEQHKIRVDLEDGGHLPGWAIRMIERWRNDR